METGSVSRKIGRGKHTTRHSEIFYVGDDTYIFDTPGFSSLYVPGMTKESLEDCYGEFEKYKEISFKMNDFNFAIASSRPL